ncbi:MAG: hypothetical protein EOO92_00075 [Pedobacter sp.]|nr:MAG: hypothetical protein EOO92_00075 [Pedobacter sp.]
MFENDNNYRKIHYWTGVDGIKLIKDSLHKKSDKEFLIALKEDAEIPVFAILIQYAVTITLILTNSFEKILLYTSLILMLSSCLAVAALFKKNNQIKMFKLIPAAIFIMLNIYAMVVVMG